MSPIPENHVKTFLECTLPLGNLRIINLAGRVGSDIYLPFRALPSSRHTRPTLSVESQV